MIRIFLNQFFKSFSEKNKERFKSYLDNYVRNPALFEELLLIYNFKNKWRDKIGYSIKKERYKIIEYNITKNNTGIKIEVKLLHRFITSIPPYETKSIEKCEYIIFLKKSLFSYKIVDLYNKEYYPALYNKVKNESFNYLDEKNNNISFLRDNIKINYWRRLLKDIDNIFLNFNTKKDNLSSYRSVRKYDVNKAISYSKKYALTYNPIYKSFNDSGGDCTNFISQCLYAGNLPKTYTWKPYSPAWIRVNSLYDYLTTNRYGKVLKNAAYNEGNILQFYSNNKGIFSHSAIITKVLSNNNCLFCCHSFDRLDYPLSELYPLIYNKLRYIEIIF